MTARKAAAIGLIAASFVSVQARAEFEIPQVDGEKGEIEVEYRGARHWGLPGPSEEDGEIDALRQSHEVEMQYAIADWWMFRVTPNVEQPAGESVELASIGFETQFVLVPRNGGSFGMALMLGYGPFSQFVDDDEPDEFEFGPVIELSTGPWLLSLNPVFVDEMGKFAEQDGLGFEYAAQLQYHFAKRWSVAGLAFGEVEDLAHAGSVDEQTHLLGPGLYLFSSPDAAGLGEEGRGRLSDAEWSLGVGALLGVTEATPEVALRVTFAVEY
jgi:hypothetical protein